MTHNQHTTTTVQVQMSGRTILDCIMHKLPSSRKYYRVTLIVPDNGVPIIGYHQTNASKKPKKSVQFSDLLFADKKYDTSERHAFSIYTKDKTITFLAQDEATMNEWLTKIKECHSKLYPEFKRYEAIFEANLLDKGLAKTMNIQGQYRLALCKESLDLIPLLSTPNQISEQYIELVLRSIRRCGHTDNNFYIESGRHSQIGEGDLWMALSKKSVARQLHELLLATMRLASATDEQYLYKTPRSRSGSSGENAHRSHQSRSSSLVCLASDPTAPQNNASNNNFDEDSGYLPMA